MTSMPSSPMPLVSTMAGESSSILSTATTNSTSPTLSPHRPPSSPFEISSSTSSTSSIVLHLLPSPRLPPPPLHILKKKHLQLENRKRYREFGQVEAELGSRWPVKRLRVTAQVIVEALKEHGGMTHQDVRDVARVTIGDTDLLDFVLKSIGNCVVDCHVVRRSPNPATRVLEFTIDKNPAGADSYVEEDEVDESSPPTTKQVERDIAYIYQSLKEGRPEAVAAVLDSKHWMKTWGLRDEEDYLLRFQRILVLSEEEMEN